MNEKELPEKELSEYVIKRVLEEYVFFLGNDYVTSMLEAIGSDINVKFERTSFNVKKGKYKLFFVKKDKNLKSFFSDVVIDDFESLIGFFFEDHKNRTSFHSYHIGKKFNYDKLSEIIYNLFNNGHDFKKIKLQSEETKK